MLKRILVLLFIISSCCFGSGLLVEICVIVLLGVGCVGLWISGISMVNSEFWFGVECISMWQLRMLVIWLMMVSLSLMLWCLEVCLVFSWLNLRKIVCNWLVGMFWLVFYIFRCILLLCWCVFSSMLLCLVQWQVLLSKLCRICDSRCVLVCIVSCGICVCRVRLVVCVIFLNFEVSGVSSLLREQLFRFGWIVFWLSWVIFSRLVSKVLVFFRVRWVCFISCSLVVGRFCLCRVLISSCVVLSGCSRLWLVVVRYLFLLWLVVLVVLCVWCNWWLSFFSLWVCLVICCFSFLFMVCRCCWVWICLVMLVMKFLINFFLLCLSSRFINISM